MNVLKNQVSDVSKLPDTKQLSQQLSSTITNWLKLHPNSELFGKLTNVTQ